MSNNHRKIISICLDKAIFIGHNNYSCFSNAKIAELDRTGLEVKESKVLSQISGIFTARNKIRIFQTNVKSKNTHVAVTCEISITG